MGAIALTQVTLASSVADDATFTVAYPSGITQASLLGATDGQMVVNGDAAFSQGASGFTAVYGASNITVTNTTGASLAAGSVIDISFGRNTMSGRYNTPIKVVGINALTAASGTASATDTVTDVGAAFNQTTLNNNFKTQAEKINAILAALDTAGITV